MFILRGSAAKLHHGWHRRDCLRMGVGGALGLLGGLPRAGATGPSSAGRGSFGRAKSCILIYLFGGPSHSDIWDLKPGARVDVRGEFRPVATNVPGVQITEHLPGLARHADKYAIIRSLTHGDGAHGSAGHTMLTGRPPGRKGEVPPDGLADFPHYGAVLSKLRPAPQAPAPFIALPRVITTSTNVIPGQNGGFLGRAMDPFRLVSRTESSYDFAMPLAEPPSNVTRTRLQQRRELLHQLEAQGGVRHNRAADEMRQLYECAYRFLGSQGVGEVFRLDRESVRLRERYGLNVFGQSLLLARRLVEAGTPVITVYWPDRREPEAFVNAGVKASVAVPAWDTHGQSVGNTPNFASLRDKLLPVLDRASVALLEDLEARGLLDQTLVIWTGEFGRTPKINGDAGRDHYGNVFSAMLGGGGIRGGQVYGSSDKIGAFPADNPVRQGRSPRRSTIAWAWPRRRRFPTGWAVPSTSAKAGLWQPWCNADPDLINSDQIIFSALRPRKSAKST